MSRFDKIQILVMSVLAGLYLSLFVVGLHVGGNIFGPICTIAVLATIGYYVYLVIFDKGQTSLSIKKITFLLMTAVILLVLIVNLCITLYIQGKP